MRTPTRLRNGGHPSIDVYRMSGTNSHSDTEVDSRRDDAPPRRTHVTHLYRCVFDATDPPSTEPGDVGVRSRWGLNHGGGPALRPTRDGRSCRSVLATVGPPSFALQDTHRYRCVHAGIIRTPSYRCVHAGAIRRPSYRCVSSAVVTWARAIRPDRPALCIWRSPSRRPATASSSSGCR